MLPSTSERVRCNTAEVINSEIDSISRENVGRYAAETAGSIERRLEKLDREWDIERALEANAAAAMLMGLGLGLCVSRRLLIIAALVGGFLLQHALQGWCPPVPIMRRFKIRTGSEIARERYALKAMRGDFRSVPAGPDGVSAAEQAWSAAR